MRNLELSSHNICYDCGFQTWVLKQNTIHLTSATKPEMEKADETQAEKNCQRNKVNANKGYRV